jgi:tripartite-type tricarboxylate transporter receptor subunit TctC
MNAIRALALALLSATASIAFAQAPADFPSRPVKLVVPFAAGGPTDVVARILADLLSARWTGQSVVIENRPGAGTIVATAAVAKAPADGYTMLIATNSLLINPAIGQKLPYDTEKDFAAVTMVAPAGVPAPLLNRLSADIGSVINSAEFADKVRNLGIFPLGNTPQELDAWMREQIVRWQEIAKAANIKAD